MSINLLLIEDDPQIRHLLPRFFEREGIQVAVAEDGQTGLQAIEQHLPELLLLDVNLPDTDGWSILRQIREELAPQLPVIMLTGRSDTPDKIKGLQLGADDYIVKPFEPIEVVARVKAVLRRTAPNAITAPPIMFPGLKIDVSTWQVSRAGQPVELSSHEFKLLHGLAKRAGRVLTRQMLADEVWGDEEYPDDHVIDVTMARLRKKLEASDRIQYITTLRGVGYRFEVNHEPS
ncbi:MAG: response regulator transcription factor [Armatimonadota bacterium]